ncbi:MAG: hypothetical protein M3130_08500 [Actinomycetota bacterium]|nr:hypothetical protein [Actinomycetota bacterium]
MLRFVGYLLILAAVVYAVFWLLDQRTRPRPPRGSTPTRRGPLGPDDDEEFLRDLNRRRRDQDGPPSA